MKKAVLIRLAALLLSLLLCATTVACTTEPAPGETPDEPTPDTPVEPTPAPEPEPEAPTYRILIASDTHCTDLMDWNGVSNEDRMQLWVDSVLAEHERQPFDLIIVAGDISLDTHDGETCYTKGYSTAEDFMLFYLSQLPDDVPIYVLAGNHETILAEDWLALTGNERQCTAVVGNNTFIMLDNFNNVLGPDAIQADYTPMDVAYIKEQMEAYPDNNVYLVAHTFPIDAGMGAESAEFRELLKDERIIGLFGGHTHLNTIVRYNESCGNKIQAQTGGFSYTLGSEFTSFWGFRDLIITEDSAVTSYIMAECDALIAGEMRHVERTLTEVIDFMNPPEPSEYTAADGSAYYKLYDYIDYSTVQGPVGQLNYPAINVLDGLDHTEWFPLYDANEQAVLTWEMTEPTEVNAYVLVTGFHDRNCIPTGWILYAGDSPSLMEPIDVRENIELPYTSRGHSEVFEIDESLVGAYTYYKLVFTGNITGAPGYELSELILLENNFSTEELLWNTNLFVFF